MTNIKVPKILSMSDVARLDICKGGACSELPFDKLLEIAYTHGLDTKKGYKVRKGLHRNLLKESVNCEYLVAEERLDDEWIKSGYATIEAIIATTSDKSLKNELRQKHNMGRSLHESTVNRLKGK